MKAKQKGWGAGDGKPSAPYKSGSDELRLREEYQTTFGGDIGTNSGKTKGSGLHSTVDRDYAKNYFAALFDSSYPSQDDLNLVFDSVRARLSSSSVRLLEKPFTAEEMKKDFRILFFCSCCAASSGIRAEFNKTLKEKFAKHNLELDTKFNMILKKLEELKPTNTHPPIRETQNIDSSATNTEHKIPIDIDESET
ncbi:hypothetical protein ACOSP7_023130 [Xanthoceras sorbifolium]